MKTINQMLKDVENANDRLNTAISEGDTTKIAAAETELKNCEKVYNAEKETMTFIACRNQDNPIQAAAVKETFNIVAHRIGKNNGIPTESTIVFRTRYIDIGKLCRFCKISTTWVNDVKSFGRDVEDRMLVDDGKMEMPINEDGSKRLGNNQLLKRVQEIIDRLVFNPGEKGGNTFRVNKHHIEMFKWCIAKNTAPNTIELSDKRNFTNMFLQMLHLVVTGEDFTIKRADWLDENGAKSKKEDVYVDNEVDVEEFDVGSGTVESSVDVELPHFDDITEEQVK